MRAAYYEDFGDLEEVQIGERPDPVPDADQMLVRTRAAGVGIWDVKMLLRGAGPASPARIIGSEIAGTVETAAGEFRVGDRVFGSVWASGGGGSAEMAALRVDRAAAMPDCIGFLEAAGLVISAGTAYEGLVDRAKLQAGESVLVTAASGGVGSAAVQIARSVRARVVAVASGRNHRYVLGLGAEVVVDYHDRDYVDQLRTAVPGGFDVLFDGTGNEVRDQALGLVHKGGRGILIAGAEPPAPDGVDVQNFAARIDAIRLSAIAQLVSDGKLHMPIEEQFPLERAREALEHVGRGHTVGRVVLRIGP